MRLLVMQFSPPFHQVGGTDEKNGVFLWADETKENTSVRITSDPATVRTEHPI
jgi:hypothetical protein